MIIENIKTAVLFILVGTSLLLTLALWNYQPTYEELGQPTYLEETRMDGDSRQLTELIHPRNIYFHNYSRHSQPPSPEDLSQLFHDTRTWSFTSIQPFVSEVSEEDEEVDILPRSMEVRFPDELPLELIGNIFTINQGERTFWNQNFDRVYFQLSDDNNEIVHVTFTSGEHDSYVDGEIQSTSVYEYIENLMNREENIPLQAYQFNEEITLYLPSERVEIPSYTLLTDEIRDIQPLINNLFNNPSMVRRQVPSGQNEESYYTDGSRALTTKRVLQNERAMQFDNPFSTDSPSMTRYEIIRRSIEFTNDHDGWTDEFYLDTIDDESNEIGYRMYYDGLPLFDIGNHTMIQQTWEDNRIRQFLRPLFVTSTNFQSEEQVRTVQSGDSVYAFFEAHQEQFSHDVQDMRVGYEVITRSDAENALFLEPEWHIKYNGQWQPFSYFESMVQTRSDE